MKNNKICCILVDFLHKIAIFLLGRTRNIFKSTFLNPPESLFVGSKSRFGRHFFLELLVFSTGVYNAMLDQCWIEVKIRNKGREKSLWFLAFLLSALLEFWPELFCSLKIETWKIAKLWIWDFLACFKPSFLMKIP